MTEDAAKTLREMVRDLSPEEKKRLRTRLREVERKLEGVLKKPY